MKTNHRHYILLFIAIATTLVSIAGYFFFYQAIIYQAEKSSQSSVNTAQEDEKRQYEKNLKSIYEKSSADRSRLGSFVIYQEKIVDFIESVEKIGDDTNTALTLSSVNTDGFSVDPKEPIGHLKAHIESKGSWANVMRVLALIENMPYSMTVNNVRIMKTTESSVSDKIDIKKQPPKVGMWNISLDIIALTSI